jgi:hypothetical protein
MAKGLLVAGFNYGMVDAGEFNDWYDTEHLPERQRCKGFINCVRWVSVDDPKVAIATYDLESHAVLHSPPYLAIGRENLSPWSKRMTGKLQRLLRIEGEQLVPGDEIARNTTENLMIFACNVKPDVLPELKRWYREEHIPRLGSVPGCVSARHFQVHSGTHNSIALYELENAQICASAVWKEAADTPWTRQMSPHFMDRLRVVLRRYQRGAA